MFPENIFLAIIFLANICLANIFLAGIFLTNIFLTNISLANISLANSEMGYMSERDGSDITSDLERTFWCAGSIQNNLKTWLFQKSTFS